MVDEARNAPFWHESRLPEPWRSMTTRERGNDLRRRGWHSIGNGAGSWIPPGGHSAWSLAAALRTVIGIELADHPEHVDHITHERGTEQ